MMPVLLKWVLSLNPPLREAKRKNSPEKQVSRQAILYTVDNTPTFRKTLLIATLTHGAVVAFIISLAIHNGNAGGTPATTETILPHPVVNRENVTWITPQAQPLDSPPPIDSVRATSLQRRRQGGGGAGRHYSPPPP